MQRITVFCGSSPGNDHLFKEQSYQLGKILAQNNIGLVYGGANIGLMGAVANGVIDHKGEVIGIIPHFLKTKETAHEHITGLITVDTMHERKTKMNELSDGVIALPGGYGTLEELFEMLTWAQLSLHHKPIAILNIGGYYNELIAMIQTMVEKGFLNQNYLDMLIVDNNIENLLKAMQCYKAPEKWLKLNES